MVPAELGVDTLERRVPLGLRLVDTAIEENPSASVSLSRRPGHRRCPGAAGERRGVSYPFRWAFLVWLC